MEDIDFKELFQRYIRQWKWFVLSVLICGALAYLKIRYSIPKYGVAAKVKIVDDTSEGLNLFEGSDLLSFGKNNVFDEIEIIRSRSNFIEVVKNLRLNINMVEVGNIKSSEIYFNKPVNVNFIAPDSVINRSEYAFFLQFDSETSFILSEDEDDAGKRYAFGKNIESPIGEIVLTPNNQVLKKYMDKKLLVTITPVDLVANFLRDEVLVSNDEDQSNIVNLSLNTPIPQKGIDILNELIKIYNQSGIDDKKEIANRTSQFIDDRIAEISFNLTAVDDDAEDLRTSRGITDIAQETNINLQTGASTRQQLTNVQNELNVASGMLDYIDGQPGYEVLPSNIGLSDASIASTTSQYNTLVSERKRLLRSSNEKNPVIVELDQQLDALKRTMRASLSSTVNNLEITANSLSGQQAIINSRIYSAPQKERALRNITRKQQTTESLYLYLLERREEAQITAISTSPKCKIVDNAYKSSRSPVAPRKKVLYMAAIIMGLLIPFSVIYLQDLMDNKVHSMQSIEKLVNNVPIIGELPKIGKKSLKKIKANDRSVLAEAMRLIRTNLDYLIKTKSNTNINNNVVFITSSTPGEGKTFVSSNLAMTLASTGKKVLLVGADIRNPRIHEFFEGTKVDTLNGNTRIKGIGLTEFLVDNDVDLKDIIQPLLVESNEIDVIYSGKIPPNPAELLLSDKLEFLFSELSKKYDYVVVDTAPMMVVTDTLLISKYSGHIVYVSRAGVTENKALEYPIKLQAEQKISGLCFIVNDVSESNLGYGGHYGYGYGKPVKKWWKFV
ncbi:GumC family protein [Flagellimonas sp. GZD32]|uniref:GumC family protein n=1 Tax=Flagellimonas cixiensis TaxID=3228750 RepID=UPI0035C935E4